MQSEPQHARTLVWALPFSLAATHRIDIFSFSSSGYLDVSVHRVPSVSLWIQNTVTEVCSAGFPHSDICGSKDICSSPQLFAAYHVFLRLLVPRHSPYALSSLTFFYLLLILKLYNLSITKLLVFLVYLISSIYFSMCFLLKFDLAFGGLKWNRTIDLMLIRHAL